ncbi:MAG TPA: ribonuclease III [Ruminococcaceae bacterium]|nr:ribonuclease III [Oscillospiraceae bacterium]
MFHNFESEPLTPAEALELNPVTLAFVGDAVYELLARGSVVAEGNASPGLLHRKAVHFARAGSQAKAVRIILPILTKEENDLIRRGRNANTVHIAKHASPADYRYATGLESLFGYLYLTGNKARIHTLFALIAEGMEKAVQSANRK